MILAHIMGMPVEETILFGFPPCSAALTAWLAQRRAAREPPEEDEEREEA